MWCGNVVGLGSVMKHEECVSEGCLVMKTGHCGQLTGFVSSGQAATSNFSAALILKRLLPLFRIETLLSRSFSPPKGMLQSRPPFLSKVEAQLDHGRGMKPQAPCGATDGKERGWATFDVP